MSNYGLIILDPQYDYLEGGSIAAFNSTRAISNLATLATGADLVVITRDLHPDNHFSFSDDPRFEDGSWPPHCVEGTRGAKIFPALRKRSDYVISKGKRPMPPDDYSAFKAKKLRPLEDLIDILGRHPVDTIVIGGFLLEIGVKFTAFDFSALGKWQEVVVPLDCCGTLLNASGIAECVAPMTKAKISVVESYS